MPEGVAVGVHDRSFLCSVIAVISVCTNSVSTGEIEMLERRKFLTALTVGMAATVMPAGIIAATLKQAGQSCTSASLQRRFAPHIGSAFRLADTTGHVTKAQLVSVDEGPHCRGLEQFSIVFEGTELCDGIYEVYHRDTGSLRISLMPSAGTTPTTVRKRAYLSLFV